MWWNVTEIVCGDAIELAKDIPDESIDLILCDPVYQDMAAYEWLGHVGNRVLKPGGSCVAQCAHYYLPQAMDMLAKNMTYYWVFSERIGRSARIWDKKLFVRWKPYLWYIKVGEPRKGRWMLDSLYSPRDKSTHKWGDGIKTMRTLVESLTDEGDTVLDPFTGGGTVPIACKTTGRNFIAYEIDEDMAMLANERLANVQMPLKIEYHTQESLI